jgi:hypothetical protein
MEQGRIEVPCVNGIADTIRSANYETALKVLIFFGFTPQLFSRSNGLTENSTTSCGSYLLWHNLSICVNKG